MADLWQTIEQAAVSLELSVRTVNRHITSGKLPSRLNNGRREVLLPESGVVSEAVATDIADDASFENDTLKSAVRDALSRLNGLADEPAVAPIDFSNAADDDALAGAFEWEQMRVSRGERETVSRSNRDSEPGPNREEKSEVSAEAVTPTESAPQVGKVESAPEHLEEKRSAATRQPDVVYVAEQAQKNAPDPGFNANTFLALVDNAADKADLAVAAYQTLARAADARVQASKRSARVAWGAVAVMGIGVSIAVGWTVHRITQSTMAAGTLEQQISAKSATLDEVSRDREALRAEMMSVREKAARAEGKLEAATQMQARLESEVKEAKAAADESSARRSATTKPSIFERMSSIFQ